jgi:biotin carboxylase
MKAAEAGINVPAFSALFNDDQIHAYIANTDAPWLVKPRGEASATGIQKAHTEEQLWQIIYSLGEKRHEYLVEQFRPGDVFHVDALNFDRKVAFARVSRYLSTPMDVAHGGGIFRSVTVKFGSADERALQKMNVEVMQAFGMNYSASHTEFIKSHEDGKYYFLETASRVGGANLAEMVEVSSGINLWAEWAKLEVAAALGDSYKIPKPRMDYAGIIVSLSRHQWPDSSSFADKEICWRLVKEYHIGMIVKASEEQAVIDLLEGYAEKIKTDFHASLPVSDKHAD